MFCGRCGQQVPDDATVCPVCGRVFSSNNVQNAIPYEQQYRQPQQQGQYQQYGQPQQYYQAAPAAAGRKKSKLPLIIAIAAAATVIIIGVVLFLVLRPKTINLEKYIDVEYYSESYSWWSWGRSDPVNGETWADASVDEVTLALALLDASGLNISYSDLYDFDISKIDNKTRRKLEKIEEAYDSIELKTVFPRGVENGELSNGDRIIVYIDYDNDLLDGTGIRFTGSEVTFTVSGLNN